MGHFGRRHGNAIASGSSVAVFCNRQTARWGALLFHLGLRTAHRAYMRVSCRYAENNGDGGSTVWSRRAAASGLYS